VPGSEEEDEETLEPAVEKEATVGDFMKGVAFRTRGEMSMSWRRVSEWAEVECDCSEIP
jgi:hypothetical protein